MLTLLAKKARLSPRMRKTSQRLFLIVSSLIFLQSCYTMLHPPKTLPSSVTTIISEPIITTSLGSSGAFGWDPYWEPALPFTSYHRGYGASYYNPYNYYDYHHPHYAPVYIISEESSPTLPRDFNRDDLQGGSRNRVINPLEGSSASNNPGGSNGGNDKPTAGPLIDVPAPNIPPVIAPTNPRDNRRARNNIPNKEVKAIKKNDVPKRPGNKKNTDNSEKDPPPKKRTRTRN